MLIKKDEFIMPEVTNATDVRKEWGSFIDNVVRFKPSLIKRNRDYLAAISLEHLEYFLKPYRFTLEYVVEDDGSFSGSLKELDLVGNAPDLKSLIDEIAGELIDYTREYMNEFNIYFAAPNRKQHFPYVMRVAIRKDREAVRDLIDA